MSASVPGLRVAIDCRTLQDRPLGGVGRLVQGQLADLARTVLVDALVDARMAPPQGLPAGVPVRALRGPLTARGYSWLQIAAPSWLRGFDGVFHCPFYGLPYRQPVPGVVSMHDLSFEFAPEWFPASNRIVFQLQARWAARTARRILTHSEHVRTMVIERYGRYGVTPERVLATHIPVDPRFRDPEPDWEAHLERLGLGGRRYVVALGGAARRRLPVAVAAWKHASELLGASTSELPLVVIGTEPPAPGDGTIYAGPLDDSAWAAVLRGAAAFCYATGYEGFGVPAAEAAASGTPIACARVGSLPELLGDAASWSENESARALGAALAALLGDEERAARIAAAGVALARALPTWTQVAEVTLRAYRESVP
jgi:glycosyltransferase involved in cell wall biosynthesis